MANQNTKNNKGVITGLSYTPYGGDVVKIEVISYPGCGNVKITGQVGDVMEESIKVAFDYIKGNYKNFGLNIDEIRNTDFHIHIPANAIKKDGPSGGITITTALLSYLKNVIISNDISMSGEITLSGKILKVGGIKEKLIAAINNNITVIYMPAANQEEIEELDYIYKNKLEINYIDNYQELYDILIAP